MRTVIRSLGLGVIAGGLLVVVLGTSSVARANDETETKERITRADDPLCGFS
jgi:hypothetical protein